ncbi:hypothetical protein CN425_25815 [Bacillus cereus]|uniref:Uncharacterized protein n=1 Tax=Bacillus cereus TaxID=1396 RepID=A0A2A8PP72_BACCE|nr:hypothetical protein CN425_25815 [Bacillus cereus]
MLKVCENHVTDGMSLLVVPVPHVSSVDDIVIRKCHFCDKQAKYRFFYSLPFYNRSIINSKKVYIK